MLIYVYLLAGCFSFSACASLFRRNRRDFSRC